MTVDKKKIRKGTKNYMQYSGLGFQLAGLIVFSIFLGSWLEGKLEMEDPLITILLILISFAGWIYKLYNSLYNKDEDGA